MLETEQKLNLVCANYPITSLKLCLVPLQTTVRYQTLEDKNKLYKHVQGNEKLEELLNKDIYYDGTVLEKLIKLSKLEKTSSEYVRLYQDIIKVGEYPI